MNSQQESIKDDGADAESKGAMNGHDGGMDVPVTSAVAIISANNTADHGNDSGST